MYFSLDLYIPNIYSSKQRDAESYMQLCNQYLCEVDHYKILLSVILIQPFHFSGAVNKFSIQVGYNVLCLSDIIIIIIINYCFFF